MTDRRAWPPGCSTASCPTATGKRRWATSRSTTNEVAAYRGEGRARLWYWEQVLNVLPRKLCHSAFWGVIMFANCLKVAFRNLAKRKGYAVINISGLAIGMA